VAREDLHRRFQAQHLVDRAAKYGIDIAVERCGFGVHDHDPGAGRLCQRHHVGDRVHLQAGTHREQHIGLVGDGHGAIDHLGHQRLPERDRGRLEDPSARAARRIVLAGRHPLEHALHRSLVAAVPTHVSVHGAVYLDDEVGSDTRLLVEPVDVLRDEGVELAPPFEGDEGNVSGIGTGRTCR
jgi:hypothetical protein